jgi:hypothetical protein
LVEGVVGGLLGVVGLLLVVLGWTQVVAGGVGPWVVVGGVVVGHFVWWVGLVRVLRLKDILGWRLIVCKVQEDKFFFLRNVLPVGEM